ncbi:hypothetical protein VTO42DRAFT_86 [Malbranchea cinnamomea]
MVVRFVRAIASKIVHHPGSTAIRLIMVPYQQVLRVSCELNCEHCSVYQTGADGVGALGPSDNPTCFIGMDNQKFIESSMPEEKTK